jgi:amino acid adenylation domain-containing protein
VTTAEAKLVFHDRGMVEARGFWQRMLDPLPPRLGIPPDFCRPGAGATAAVQTFPLTPALIAELARITRNSALLTQAVVAAAAAVVIGRYHAVPAVLLGCPAGDADASLLPVILAPDPAMSFKAFLLAVRKTLVEARAQQHFPWERLIDADAAPPFAVAVSAGTPAPPLDALDLSIAADELLSAGRLRLAYDENRFAAATIDQAGRHLVHVIASALAALDRPLADIAMMDEAERRRVLVEWQGAPVEPGTPATLDDLFRQQVRLAPGRWAVAAEGEGLDYAALDGAADALAHALRQAGAGRGCIVGICLPAEASRIAAVLGAIRAGAAFLPLDPDYPPERLAFMAEDTGIAAVVTTPALRARVPVPGLAMVDPAAVAPAEPLPCMTTPADPAYVIYTSGSTGRPKGVVIAHRGLANLITEQIRLFAVTPLSRVLQFASFSFDAAISEIGMALAAGATLALAPREAMIPGPPLAEFLRARAITHVTLPPSSLAAMPEVALPDLATLVVAGEACPAALADRWAPNRRFINGYGPTEYTVGASFAACPPGLARLPIGRPIAGTRAYVLAADGAHAPAPQPVGVPGELYLGGVGLALGYLGRPALTAERFIPDHLSGEAGARLYRTGDRVRWRGDGELDFLGRIDDQIKLRGYRIEPGEIEAALAAHPQVGEAAVVLRDDGRGEDQLVAFVTARDGETAAEPQALRRHLEQTLPPHMLPQAFVRLERLPQTPNRKIDRAALRQLRSEETRVLTGLPPRDSIELTLLRIWKKILGRSDIGVTDNFFELGGHSMLAVRLMAAIEEATGCRLEVNTLFAAPNVEGLAAALRRNPGPRAWSPVVPLNAGGSRPPLWLVHPAGGGVLCYGALTAALGAEQPVFGLQQPGSASGQGAPTQTPDSVEALAAYYLEALRQHEGAGPKLSEPKLIAGWSFGGLVAQAMAQALAAAGTPARFVGLIDTFAPTILPTVLRDLDDAQHLVNLFGADLPLSVEGLRLLAPDARLAHVLELAQARALVPPDFGRDEARRLLDLYRYNAAAVFTCRPKPLAGRLTLIRARTPPRGPAGDAATHPTLGWEATAGVDVIWIAGDHQAIMRPPGVTDLAAALTRAIDAALAE